MEGNPRAHASTGPPSKGYLFSPSLIRKADILSDPPIAYFAKAPANLTFYDNKNKNQLFSETRNLRSPNWEASWRPPTISPNGAAIYSDSNKDNSWDPNWKILSSEVPSSHHRRDYMNEILSTRSNDLNYPKLSSTGYYKKERMDNDVQSSSNLSSYGNLKTHIGSYSQKFTQGEPYLPVNKSFNYLHLREAHSQLDQWPKHNNYISKSPTCYKYNDRPSSPCKASYNRDDLYKTFSINTEPMQLQEGTSYQDYYHMSKAKKSTKYSRQNAWMAPPIAEKVITEKRIDMKPDKLTLIRRRFQLNNEIDNGSIESKNEVHKSHPLPVRSERRRSLSVVPIRTGWTEKVEPGHNKDSPEISNLSYAHESDDNASIHDFLKRENNYISSKGVYESNSSETKINNTINTKSYTSGPNLGPDCDKSEDETKSCHDFYKARLKHKSPAKIAPNSNTSTPQRRNLSEKKTMYSATEDLMDFPVAPNNKWLGELVIRLKISTNEWNMNLQALVDTRRLAKYHPSLLFHMTPISNTSATFNPLNLRIVVNEVVKLLNSPRSSLAKHAALCLMDLYYFGGKKMDHVNEDIIPSCLKKSSQHSSDFLSEAAYCVLVQMCRHVSPTKALNTILHVTHTSRHQGFKTVGVKCIAVLIHRLKAQITKTKEVSAVINLLKTTLCEASSEIRNVSKMAIFLLMRYVGNRLEELIESGIITETDLNDFQAATSRIDESQLDLILDPYQHTNIFGICISNKPQSTSYQPGIKSKPKT